MIATTLAAAVLASTQPAQTAPPPMADHAAMADHQGTAKAKMDCCKDGCECCAKKDAAKAPAR